MTKIQVRLRPCCSCWHEVDGLVQGDCWVELIHLIVSDICFATSTVSDKSLHFRGIGSDFRKLVRFLKRQKLFQNNCKISRGLGSISFSSKIFADLSEDNVLAIQPLGLGGAEEELGPVGVGPRVGHRQHT